MQQNVGGRLFVSLSNKGASEVRYPQEKVPENILWEFHNGQLVLVHSF